jgi:predicted DNA-binding transcriptional regulator YafY
VQGVEKVLVMLEHFQSHIDKDIDSYDTELQKKLGVDQRQLSRDLKLMEQYIDPIVEVKVGKRKAYRMIRSLDILKESYRHNSESLTMLYEMAKEGMPELFEELESINRTDNTLYRFYGTPLEERDIIENNPHFKHLKNAIIRREYRTITLKGGKTFRDVKPLKILFSEGNWYIAYVDKQELRISRISFIEEVSYSKRSESYQPKSIESYLKWLEEAFQNSFSRYGTVPKRAYLRAMPNIAHYFEPDMKRFFKTQRFIERCDDGSIRFGIDYTQEMEILPFVQRWMPDILIEAPAELNEAFRKKLQTALRSTV